MDPGAPDAAVASTGRAAAKPRAREMKERGREQGGAEPAAGAGIAPPARPQFEERGLSAPLPEKGAVENCLSPRFWCRTDVQRVFWIVIGLGGLGRHAGRSGVDRPGVHCCQCTQWRPMETGREVRAARRCRIRGGTRALPPPLAHQGGRGRRLRSNSPEGTAEGEPGSL